MTIWRLTKTPKIQIAKTRSVKIPGRECQKLFIDEQFVVLFCCNESENQYVISLRSLNDLDLIRSKSIHVAERTDVHDGFYYANGWIALGLFDKSIR